MEKYFRSLLDYIAEGVAFLDKDLNVRYLNRRFEEMMGLYTNNGPGHPGGQAAAGDYVLVACSAIDRQEEILTREHLRLIGVDTKEIERDDAVLAIGRLGAAPGKAQWKSARYHDEDLIVDLSGELPGDTKVSLQINGMDNELIIHVNHQKLKLKYQSYDAFFVILDGHTLEIKFYQSRGYSLRREVFPEIIKGMTYRPKGASYRAEDHIGRNFRDFLPSEKCLEATSSVLSGEKNLVENIQIEVNTMFFLMSAYPQIDGEGRMEGCAVIFKDLTMVKQLQRHIKEKRLKEAAFSSIVGSSDAMRQTIEIASKISHTRSTVLILGESGTGKGLFARAIHDNSKNRAKSFVPINMAAIPPNLLESELFGYAAGAFTGAGPKGKIGLFKAADGGTVFLDEIGDMDLNLQAKILQVLQEGIIYPVGSVLPEKIDVRVIAATHRDLEEAARSGRFRADLYYRLNVVTLELPPLRERKSDIRELVNHLLPEISKKVGKTVSRLDEEVENLFYLYDWPGNVRELENILESAANMAESRSILVEDLPKRFLEALSGRLRDKKAITSIREASDSAEKEMIQAVLNLTEGNRLAAAKMLKISRTTFYNKLRKYGIE